jgi:hypothetical protein
VSKRKRGRETALDMVRSLGLVFLAVLPIWYFAQAPASDEAELREVIRQAPSRRSPPTSPRFPCPGRLPGGLARHRVDLQRGDTALRVGWVTPQEQYAEYSASQVEPEEFLEQTVGEEVEQLAPLALEGD